jgi:hypothetical protein
LAFKHVCDSKEILPVMHILRTIQTWFLCSNLLNFGYHTNLLFPACRNNLARSSIETLVGVYIEAMNSNSKFHLSAEDELQVVEGLRYAKLLCWFS